MQLVTVSGHCTTEPTDDKTHHRHLPLLLDHYKGEWTCGLLPFFVLSDGLMGLLLSL